MSAAHAEPTRDQRKKPRSPRLRWLGGPAVAAAILVLLVWIGPLSTGVPRASAEVLRVAMSSLEQADSVHILTEVDEGPNTAVFRSWELWCDQTLGYRTDHASYVEVYNAVKHRRYTYDRLADTLEETELYDPVMVLVFLRRSKVEHNCNTLRVQAMSGDERFEDETLTRGNRTIRRMSGLDELGRPIIVDIDPHAGRVLRTESWTMPSDDYPSVRVVKTFEFLSPDEIDPALFEPPHGEATQRQTPSDDEQERVQCMSNLRSIMSLISTYAHERDGALPSALGDLKDLTDFDPALLACPHGPAPYTYHARELGAQHFDDLPFDAVVVECVNHAGRVIRGFGGGHAMAERVQTPSADEQERTQCTKNILSIMWLIPIYAHERDGVLPLALEDLRDMEGGDPALLACPRGPEPYIYRARELGARHRDDLPDDGVVVECVNHPGWVIRGFGDGHATTERVADE